MRGAPACTLIVIAMLGAACPRRSPPPAAADDELEEIRNVTAGCPVPLTDAALDDLATYERCHLPPAIRRLVRNDYADDELAIPDLAHLATRAREVPRVTFEAQLHRFVDPAGVLAGTVDIDEVHDLLRPDPILAPEVAVPFAPGASHEARAASGRCALDASCTGRLVTPPHPERPYRARRRSELLAASAPGHPLAGVRVGIDPGHAGGPYAIVEDRHLAFARNGTPGAVALQEGDLTLRTALELRAKLVARGAQVVLTRDAPGLVHPYPLHAFRPAAERLLRRIALDPAYARVEDALAPAARAQLRSALAVYAVKKQNGFESLRARAITLSAANPDIVLSIHYNAAPRRADRGEPQHVVAMVGGFYGASRLYNPYFRWRALEAAFAVDDFDASAHLGAMCIRSMADELAIPVARENWYDDHLPIRDGAGQPVGVDAWDGALLRYLDGVAVLTEGPYMDAPGETERLLAALAAPAGTAGTRVEAYAGALSTCVEQFVARWLGSDRNPFSGDPPTPPPAPLPRHQ